MMNVHDKNKEDNNKEFRNMRLERNEHQNSG